MARNPFTMIVYIIIGLAAIGLISALLRNAVGFLTGLFISLVIGILIFAAIYFLFLRNRRTSNEMKQYKKAVKQSKAKYQQANQPTGTKPKYKKTTNPPSKKKKHKRPSHLRVIDGNKTKRNKRISN